ncbi:hypothetical protein B0H16DRAFT_1626641, partial [Mycena metata]
EAAILQCAQLLLSAALQGPQYPTDQQTIGTMQCHCEARAWLHLGNTVGIIFSAYHGIYQYDLLHRNVTQKNRIPPILGKHIFPIKSLARCHIWHHLALIFCKSKARFPTSQQAPPPVNQCLLPRPAPLQRPRLRPDDNGSFGFKSTSLDFNHRLALWVIIHPCLL